MTSMVFYFISLSIILILSIIMLFFNRRDYRKLRKEEKKLIEKLDKYQDLLKVESISKMGQIQNPVYNKYIKYTNEKSGRFTYHLEISHEKPLSIINYTKNWIKFYKNEIRIIERDFQEVEYFKLTNREKSLNDILNN